MTSRTRRASPPLRGALAGLVAWGSATGGSAQDIAPAGPTAGPHGACAAALHAWASRLGGHPGLATFGTGQGVGTAAAAPPAAGEAPGGFVGLGPAAFRGAGPVDAGATLGDESTGYAYPGPARGRRDLEGMRVVGAWGGSGWRAGADVLVDPRGAMIRALGVAVRTPSVTVYAGALPLRTGPTCQDGLVLGGKGGPAGGVEVGTRGGIRVPFLGRVHVGAQVGTLAEAGPENRRPFFHALRVELEPHPDLGLGLQRAAVFGGSASAIPVTPRTVGLMLLGLTDTRGKDSDFENQVASVDARWRTRFLGRPALLTVEAAADDSGWAFLRVPGTRVTGSVRWGPHALGWTGFEWARLSGPTGRYPPWYRHGALAWGWTDRGTPLGSPLGGEGTLLAATWSVEAPGLSVRLALGGASRGRANLLAAPDGDAAVWASGSVRARRGAWEAAAAGHGWAGPTPSWRLAASLLRRF
ncbi:MAG: hypothetical protein AMXMBFR53_17950 [Gemmatimonadota bacterium]